MTLLNLVPPFRAGFAPPLTRLISDVEGFALDPASRDAGHPDATEIPFLDVQIINATLRRRVFTAIPGLGAVEYAHRTTAEFLAAEWLAARLNDGLSFRRLGALLGHDGRPVSQLRGLHAWLTVRAPRFAEQLVASDPYGAHTAIRPPARPHSDSVCWAHWPRWLWTIRGFCQETVGRQASA